MLGCSPRGDIVSDLFAVFGFGKAQLIRFLEIHPELRRRAEPAPKAEGGIGGDPAPPTNDLCNPVGWDAQILGQFRGRHVKELELIGDVLTWVNGWSCHSVLSVPEIESSPAVLDREPLVQWLAMVIHDLNVEWPRLLLGPFEADAPLHVDADAVLTLAISNELFETITWKIM